MENADIVMLVFALNEHGTYDVSEYITDVLAIHSHPTWAIVGNKVDLVEMGKLDLTLVNKFAEKHEVPLVFTSAKNNMNVQDVFLDLVTRHVATKA
jgi:predicted GTPase